MRTSVRIAVVLAGLLLSCAACGIKRTGGGGPANDAGAGGATTTETAGNGGAGG